MDWSKVRKVIKGKTDLRPDMRVDDNNVLYNNPEEMALAHISEEDLVPFRKAVPTQLEALGKGIMEGADSRMIEDENFRQDAWPETFAAGEVIGSTIPTSPTIGGFLKLKEMLKGKK